MHPSRAPTGSPGSPEPGGGDLVVAERVSKRFGLRAALRPLDLRVARGERVVLLGPNGAGKTTLLRILATLSRPSTGRVAIDGLDAAREAQEVRRRVGVVAHQPYLYDDLTAAENLRFFARMYRLPDAEARVAASLEAVGLAARRDDRVRTFSRGMQQRLAIARATLHRPPLLLLDEPDSGLDRAGMLLLQDLLAAHARSGGSTVMTTHDLAYGLAVADRVVVLESGRLVVDEAPSALSVEELERWMGVRR
ncbi:MAG: heme ABC exporter ATP-binding protein CcmA [Thermomicrobiaceae bacterium]|nr:heme ABC exporter ATP-binding protein CcmA [Thermomicrobiaceae bacterium]